VSRFSSTPAPESHLLRVPTLHTACTAPDTIHYDGHRLCSLVRYIASSGQLIAWHLRGTGGGICLVITADEANFEPWPPLATFPKARKQSCRGPRWNIRPATASFNDYTHITSFNLTHTTLLLCDYCRPELTTLGQNFVASQRVGARHDTCTPTSSTRAQDNTSRIQPISI
jgi:hypothetical protein